MRDTLTNSGKLGLRLLEDLTALAAGGSVCAKLISIIAFLAKDNYPSNRILSSGN